MKETPRDLGDPTLVIETTKGWPWENYVRVPWKGLHDVENKGFFGVEKENQIPLNGSERTFYRSKSLARIWIALF